MSRLSKRALRFVLLGAVAAAASLGCSRADDPVVRADAPAAKDSEKTVATDHVRRGAVLQRISAPGSLVARRESQIGPEVAGRIERIFVQEGDHVAEGDPLFEIDREPHEIALRQAEARLDRVRAERQKIETDLERGKKLRTQNVLAEQKLDELTTALAVATAAQREAESQVAMARLNLEHSLVRAPYDASVAARLVDEGTTALVQPQTILIVLQETGELEAQATIPEVHFAAIRVGDAALVHVEGLAHPISTEVSAIADAIDPATRTYLVKMRVPNPERRLKAGVFARIEILPRAKQDVLVVPKEAVRRENGGTSVLVVRDGRAEAVPVRLGVVAEDVAEVLSGVRVDEEILVGSDASTVAPGTPVRTRTSGSDPAAPGPDSPGPDAPGSDAPAPTAAP